MNISPAAYDDNGTSFGPCPECGEMCQIREVINDSGRIQCIQIDCRLCGNLTVEFDYRKGYWAVDGSGTPYIQEMMSNEAAQYERFDLAHYDNKSEGLEDELSLLSSLIEYSSDIPYLYLRYNRDMVQCVRTMNSMGIRRYDGYLLKAMGNLLEYSDTETAQRMVHEMIPLIGSADDEILCHIADRMRRAESILGIHFPEYDTVVDIIYDRLMGYGSITGRDLETLDGMFLILEGSNHPGVGRAAIRLVDYTMDMDDEEKYGNLAHFYSDICDSVQDADVVGMMLAAVREFDRDGWDPYFNILLRYAELMSDRPGSGEHVAALLREGIMMMEERNADNQRMNRVLVDRNRDCHPYSDYIAVASMYLDMLEPKENHIRRAMHEALIDRCNSERMVFPVIHYCLSSDSVSKRKKDLFRIKAVRMFPRYAEYEEMCTMADKGKILT